MNLQKSDRNRAELDRRDFFKRVVYLTGAAGAAGALSPLLRRTSAAAQISAENDSRLHTEMVLYPTETGEMRAYWAKPIEAKKLPAVIIIHENRGLVPHIKDVTRRMALEGFLAIAPDALSPLGGTPDDPEERRARMSQIDYEETVQNFVAAVKYLKTHPLATGKVGCTGFCWGGAMANQVAVHAPEVDAVVPYYGRQPAAEDVPKIKASLLLHYAGNDERINAGISAYEEALDKASIEYKVFMYDGTGHAFNNDTGSRYNKEAADLAWERTVAFFKEKLKT